MDIATEFVNSLLECNLMICSETLFTEVIREFDSEQMKSMTGRAYDLLADGVCTGGQLTWQRS